MIKRLKKVFIRNLPTLYILFAYLLFFYKLLVPSSILWGDDLGYFYYPVRVYLSDNLRAGRFPFWTEKLFGGFPIFAETEVSYLNPLNLIATFVLGPFISYKFIHFLLYFLGSLALLSFLRKKGLGLLSFIIAHFTFFFNSFGLYHQDHQNLIFVMYLIPVMLLLGDFFLESKTADKKARIIVLNAVLISFCIYFGGLQMVMIGAMLEGFYILFMGLKRTNVKGILLSLFLLFLGAVIFSLPLITSSFMLWGKSARTEETFSYRKGSLLPYMAALPFYPNIFGNGQDFYGKKVSDDYHEHEIYIYLGISASILAIAGLVFLRNDRFKFYCYFLLWLFFVLGFLRSIPFTTFFDLPVVSLFRYWVRSSVFAAVSVSLLSALFVDALQRVGSIYFNKRNLLLVLVPILYFAVLVAINYSHNEMTRIARFFKEGKFDTGKGFLVWLVILCLTLLMAWLLQRIRNQQVRTLLVFALCLLTISDLFTFGKNILRFRRVENMAINEKYFNKFVDKRVIWTKDVFSNQALYYDTWSIFGYSQLLGSDYEAVLKDSGLAYVRRPDDLNNASYTSLKTLGVFAIAEDYLEKPLFDSDKLELFGGFPGTYLEKKEGLIKVALDASAQQTNGELKTAIRNYPSWKVLLDGNPVQYSKDTPFLSFEVAPGKHLIEAYYTPTYLVVGIVLFLFFSTLYISFMRSRYYSYLW